MDRTSIQEKINFFQQNGYVIFERVVDHSTIDKFAENFDLLLQQDRPLKINLLGDIVSFQSLASDIEREKFIRYGRFIDIENFSALGKKLIFYPAISQFLSNLFQGNQPTSLQSLTYKYSSQQGEHSDKYLVSPDWAGKYKRESLTASWIALEDADENNGALIIYPGSHLIPNKKRLAEDFNNNYEDYVEYCQQICEQHNIKPEYFYAKKGDILFWHGDFIHAGGEVRDWSKTRFSIVCHYANIDDNHFPLSLKTFRCYRQRVNYQNLGYFYQDLPKVHLKRDTLKFIDKVLIKYHRTQVQIAQLRHLIRILIIDNIKRVIKFAIAHKYWKKQDKS